MPPLFDLDTLLHRLHDLAGGRPLYLVGGSVRDLLMERPVKDVDVALPGPVEAFGRQVAKSLRGSFFYLRQAEETARIVLGKSTGLEDGVQVRQVDLVALHGGSIEADLRRRDFTVNAMALNLSQFPPLLRPERLGRVLIDPLGGRDDLLSGCIRCCTPHSLPQDPLRCLRAVRFAAAFGWEIEEETRAQVVETGSLLDRVSAERIRDELFMMLQLPPDASMDALELLSTLGLLEAALRGAVDPAGLERIRRLHDRYRELDSETNYLHRSWRSYLEETINDERFRFALVKLNALYGPVVMEPGEGGGRKEHSRQLAAVRSRLELSASEAAFLRKTWSAAYRLLSLPPEQIPAPLTVHRLLREYGDAIPAAALLASAEEPGRADSEPETAWLQAWFYERERYLPAPLLNGHDLMKGLKRPGGPWVSEALEALQEAQVTGEVADTESAWAFVRERLEEAGV